MKKAPIILMFILFFVSKAYATPSYYEGYITEVMTGPHPKYTGRMFVKIDGIPANRDTVSCHKNTAYDYIFTAHTEQGRVTSSLILAAHMAGKKILIAGNGYCNLAPEFETEELDYIIIKSN